MRSQLAKINSRVLPRNLFQGSLLLKRSSPSFVASLQDAKGKSQDQRKHNYYRMSGGFLIGILGIAKLLSEDERSLPALTLDDLYPLPGAPKIDWSGAPLRIHRWLNNGTEYIIETKDDKDQAPVLLCVDAKTGKSRKLYDTDKIYSALQTIPEMKIEEAQKFFKDSQVSFSPDESALLLQHSTGLFYVELESLQAKKLLTQSSKFEEAVNVPTFSPDGQKLAFIRANDLFVIDLKESKETRLTWGGSENTFNGILDWVYQEEIYGRGDFQGYWWSPDSKSLAFLQLDETPVPSFTVVDPRPTHGLVEVTRYPKAGDPNPLPKLGVINLDRYTSIKESAENKHVRWLDLSKYKPEDLLIVDVGWTPDSSHVVYQAQNKEQTQLDLNLASPISGKLVKTLVKERPPAWVERSQVSWLDSGKSFLWLSEESGWRHLYHYSLDGTLKNQITQGDFEIRHFHGVNEKDGYAYFSANVRDLLGTDVYRIKLDGTDFTRLAADRSTGSHSAIFNKDFSYFLDTWSDLQTPPQIKLYKSNGTFSRNVDVETSEKLLATLAKFQPLPKFERVEVPTRDGFIMDGFICKPLFDDKSQKYPVLMYAYAGPHHPATQDSWVGSSRLWHQYLASHGYIIWFCDNRTASGKGIQSTWPLHKNFGELELKDIEDSIDFLKTKSYVDSKRIGLWGWSFGGYITAYALLHSDYFKLGISGAPVTDWKLYDTIYTERFMSTPQNNPHGYQKSSLLDKADRLKGKLLIIHGLIDDNVHAQQTMQFIQQLQKSGKLFDLMIYPTSRHGVVDPYAVRHLRLMMTDYIQKNL